MQMDPVTGAIIGFHEPILHIFNKNEFTGLMKWPRRIADVDDVTQDDTTTQDDATLNDAKDRGCSVNGVRSSFAAAERTPSPEMALQERDPCHDDGGVVTMVAADTSQQLPAGWNPNAALPHRRLVLERGNVILVGDSVGDARMADGVDHHVLLRIGLCNRVDLDEHGAPYLLPAGGGGDGKAATTATSNNNNNDNMNGNTTTPNTPAPAAGNDDPTVILREFQRAFDIVVCGDLGFDEWLVPLLRGICGEQQHGEEQQQQQVSSSTEVHPHPHQPREGVYAAAEL